MAPVVIRLLIPPLFDSSFSEILPEQSAWASTYQDPDAPAGIAAEYAIDLALPGAREEVNTLARYKSEGSTTVSLER
jgi:hypothetical protein